MGVVLVGLVATAWHGIVARVSCRVGLVAVHRHGRRVVVVAWASCRVVLVVLARLRLARACVLIV
jgi:hypothetical protein